MSFAPIAGRRRLTGVLWLALLALGFAAGLALALPMDTAACGPPGTAGHPECMRHALGHVVTIALISSVVTMTLGHLCCAALVRAYGRAFEDRRTALRKALPRRASSPAVSPSQPRPAR